MLPTSSTGWARWFVAAPSAATLLTMATCLVVAQQPAASPSQPDRGIDPQTSPPNAQASTAPAKLRLKQRNQLDERALREALLKVPEVALLDGRSETTESLKVELLVRAETQAPVATARSPAGRRAEGSAVEKPTLSLAFQHGRWKALGLQPIVEAEAQLDRYASRTLQQTTADLRGSGFVSMLGRNGEIFPPCATRRTMGTELGKELNTQEPIGAAGSAVPAVVQLMQAEEEPSRLLLIEVLATIKHPSASRALAQRAVYDLSPAVREAALRALQDRPRPEYRRALLEGLRYPWAPVADHAAEALVALQDRQAVAALRALLDAPDPQAPIEKAGTGTPSSVRELVRVNHFRNCLLCHAPSFDVKDPVVGLVPTPGKEISPQYSVRRRSPGDLLVRADVTYLRQDFSVMQPVADASPWPDKQRYDFLVRLRPATTNELARRDKPSATYPQREAVRFALKELSE
jgi:hypothetical protein